MKRASFLTNAIMAIMIVVLGCTLLYTVFSYRSREQERTNALREEAERVRQEQEPAGEEPEADQEEGGDAEADAEAAAKAEAEAQAKAEEEAKAKAEEEAKAEAEAAAKAETPAGPVRISCRGESWQEDGADPEGGWPKKLGKLLKDAGVDAKVTDATFDMAGSLSQLLLAGVSQDTVDNYIQAHRDKGLQDDVYEVVIRSDLNEKKTERKDLKAIPVLCIGYHGGYGRASAELRDQQELLLKTYDLQQPTGDREYKDGKRGISGKYIILGKLPAGWEDLDGYEKKMKEAWGDHYASLNGIEGDVLSDEYRQAVAKVVYEKLKDLGYLE